MKIEGSVKPGFEAVKETFQHRMASLKEINAQLCIYVEEECVVDLWGSVTDDPNFGPDSLINVFSSGKSLESIALAMLVDRGLIEFSDRITTHWPEFGENGKEETTIADLMRHEGGMAAFDQALSVQNLQPEALKRNEIGLLIEKHDQKYREGENNQREYHAITRGWIANELFRRVEPEGRTMGEFIRSEISKKLEADIYIGLTDAEIERINPVKAVGAGFQFLEGLKPSLLGRKMELNLFQLIGRALFFRKALAGNSRPNAPDPIRGSGLMNMDLFNDPEFSKGETPSAGAKCTARGLAKLAAAMACGGSLGGKKVLSEVAHQKLHDGIETRNMAFIDTAFSQGGINYFGGKGIGSDVLNDGLHKGREGFFGWMGLGGSIFQWHPELKIGFAYIPTSLNILDVVNSRGKIYQEVVRECVEG